MSGISKLSDVDSSIASGTAPHFPIEQAMRIHSTLDQSNEDRRAFCTGCRYCIPCPQGIDIPMVMAAVAEHTIWGFADHARNVYSELAPKADACIKCGECEARCTQHLDIMDEMDRAADTFGG